MMICLWCDRPMSGVMFVAIFIFNIFIAQNWECQTAEICIKTCLNASFFEYGPHWWLGDSCHDKISMLGQMFVSFLSWSTDQMIFEFVWYTFQNRLQKTWRRGQCSHAFFSTHTSQTTPCIVTRHLQYIRFRFPKVVSKNTTIWMRQLCTTIPSFWT